MCHFISLYLNNPALILVASCNEAFYLNENLKDPHELDLTVCFFYLEEKDQDMSFKEYFLSIPTVTIH